jgi:hypothetical protein
MGQLPSVKLVLANREVCVECNSDLSALDQCLQDELGFLRVIWNTTGTKRGRVVTAIRPGLYAARRGEAIELAIDAEGWPAKASDGTPVPRARGQRNAIEVTERTEGGIKIFRVSQPVHITKRFIRALHKIAFELVAYENGFDAVLHSSLNPLRRYIRFGEGRRSVGIVGRPNDIVSLSLPANPRLELRRDSMWGWLARLQLGRVFLVHVGTSAVVRWGDDITVPHANPCTIIHVSFDVTPSQEVGGA